MRTHKKNAVLFGDFGKQWNRWSTKTTHPLIPHVYRLELITVASVRRV